MFDKYNRPITRQEFALKAYTKGIIGGFEDGSFHGGENATRSQIAVMVHQRHENFIERSRLRMQLASFYLCDKIQMHSVMLFFT